jgi:nucleoside-diphosphate-sugar epimerase
MGLEYVFQSVRDLEDYVNIHVNDVVDASLLAMENDKA